MACGQRGPERTRTRLPAPRHQGLAPRLGTGVPPFVCFTRRGWDEADACAKFSTTSMRNSGNGRARTGWSSCRCCWRRRQRRFREKISPTATTRQIHVRHPSPSTAAQQHAASRGRQCARASVTRRRAGIELSEPTSQLPDECVTFPSTWPPRQSSPRGLEYRRTQIASRGALWANCASRSSRDRARCPVTWVLADSGSRAVMAASTWVCSSLVLRRSSAVSCGPRS